MRSPHDPLPALRGKCTDRRQDPCTPDGTRKNPRPVSSSSLRGSISFFFFFFFFFFYFFFFFFFFFLVLCFVSPFEFFLRPFLSVQNF
jgi:hypothetical protein